MKSLVKYFLVVITCIMIFSLVGCTSTYDNDSVEWFKSNKSGEFLTNFDYEGLEKVDSYNYNYLKEVNDVLYEALQNTSYGENINNLIDVQVKYSKAPESYDYRLNRDIMNYNDESINLLKSLANNKDDSVVINNFYTSYRNLSDNIFLLMENVKSNDIETNTIVNDIPEFIECVFCGSQEYVTLNNRGCNDCGEAVDNLDYLLEELGY